MYKIEAIVRPERLNDVQHELVQLGFDEFTVLDAHGHGSEPGPRACYRGVTYEVPFTHQTCVELCVPETALEVALERIVRAAHTGQPGDGRIFVTALSEVIDITCDKTVYSSESVPMARRSVAATADVGWQQGW